MRFIQPSALVLGAFLSSALVRSEPSIAGVSWGPDRIDLFGPDPEGNIWHKFYSKYGWEPNNGLGNLEVFKGANANSSVSVASWGSNRINYVFVDKAGTVRHKYWTGSEWGPAGTEFEDLGDGPEGKLSINSWGKDRLDIVGRSENGTCLHKAWTGSSWYPAVKEWEDLGGDLASEPVVVSWGEGRLDVFGITNEGNMSHKYWDGVSWNPQGKKWEDLGGKNFSGSPVATSMSALRIDVWAVGDEDGSLYHLYWDIFASEWRGWESLGGHKFVNAPQVVHWGPNRIDILGLESGGDGQYSYKYWDGTQWSKWYERVGKFASEPAMVSLGENNLNLYGVDGGGKVLTQIWDGSQWLPDTVHWYELGDTTAIGVDDHLKVQTSSSRFFRNTEFELRRS